MVANGECCYLDIQWNNVGTGLKFMSCFTPFLIAAALGRESQNEVFQQSGKGKLEGRVTPMWTIGANYRVSWWQPGYREK